MSARGAVLGVTGANGMCLPLSRSSFIVTEATRLWLGEVRRALCGSRKTGETAVCAPVPRHIRASSAPVAARPTPRGRSGSARTRRPFGCHSYGVSTSSHGCSASSRSCIPWQAGASGTPGHDMCCPSQPFVPSDTAFIGGIVCSSCGHVPVRELRHRAWRCTPRRDRTDRQYLRRVGPRLRACDRR